MKFQFQNNRIEHLRSNNFSNLAKWFSAILSDFKLSFFHEPTNLWEDLLEFKQEHFHGELDEQLGNCDRNHHSAFVLLFLCFFVGLVLIKEHEFQRNKNVHFEEVNKRRRLKLWLLALLFFLHGHELFIEQHEVAVDGIFRLEIVQILCQLIFLFGFFLFFIFFIRILLLSFLIESSGSSDKFGMELIKTMLCNVLLNVGCTFW